jgi:hypothetical protein
LKRPDRAASTTANSSYAESDVELSNSLREYLVEELDKFLEAYADRPDIEALVAYIVEELETWADEKGIDDILGELEEEGELDAPFAEVLEEELESNDEFEFTGEEIVSLLERIFPIEWEEAEDDDDSFFDEEEEDEEEERDHEEEF